MVVVVVEGGLSDERQYHFFDTCVEVWLPSRLCCHHHHLKQQDFGNRQAETHGRERLVPAFIQDIQLFAQSAYCHRPVHTPHVALPLRNVGIALPTLSPSSAGLDVGTRRRATLAIRSPGTPPRTAPHHRAEP